MNKQHSKTSNIIHIIYLILLSCAFAASTLYITLFKHEYVEELIFYGLNGDGGTVDPLIIIKCVKACILYAILMFVFLLFITHNILIKKNIKIKDKIIYPFNFIIKKRALFTTIITLIIVVISLNNLKVFDYIKYQSKESTFFKDNYKKVTSSDITFNKTKKNLIMIYVESLETSFFSKEHGGCSNKEIIPELYDLLSDDDAIYFSSTDNGTGEYNLFGTTYTSASVFSNSTGIPLKIPALKYVRFTDSDMLNNTYALGDALKDNGYTNEVISAADAEYGALDKFYIKHGSSNIIDPGSLKDYGYKMKSADKGSWGFNDRYMYNIAEDRLTTLAKDDKNFALTLIGIDTHHIDGYNGEYTINEFDTQYYNAYRTESKLIYDFVKWVQKQDFYKNTTIVITGDHLAMQSNITDNMDQNLRRRYTVILNSATTTDNTQNRVFTSVDMYPTILASMGAKIKDDKLGLGVNLYSDKSTLTEEYGIDYVNEELKKNSSYYTKEILGK